MENNEEYLGVVTLLKDLDAQLSLCGKYSKILALSGMEAEEEIEQHFRKCEVALAERKAKLLSDCAYQFKECRDNIAENETKLKTTISACKTNMEYGSFIFQTDVKTAEGIWKALRKIQPPSISETRIVVNLSGTFLDSILRYGEVMGHTKQQTSSAIRTHGQFRTPDSVTTFAGSAKGFEDGKGTSAKFDAPEGICFNPLNNCFYVCDSNNHAIRKITLQGDVTTFVKDDPLVYFPVTIAMNYKENCFYVANYPTHNIVKVSATGVTSTFVGSGKSGLTDGIRDLASFNKICGIAIDQASGVLYTCEYANNVVRVITPQGEVSVLAGSLERGCVDGRGKNAKFAGLMGIFFDEVDRSLLVCDRFNNKIRRVSLDGTTKGEVSTLCECKAPSRGLITRNRTILITSYGSNKIYKISLQASGKYETQFLAGSGKQERVDGNATECGFEGPLWMEVHEPTQTCFICEDSHTIRKLSFV